MTVQERYEERMDELETRVAFQDELLQSMSREVADLQLRHYRLQEEFLRMRQWLESVRAAPEGGDERPPHY